MGRPVIISPSVALDVYQEEKVGDLVVLMMVKVGAYAMDGAAQRLVGHARALGQLAKLDDRKVRARLGLTDDVDCVGVATLRVSRQPAASNALQPVWERDYQFNRAFGMDF